MAKLGKIIYYLLCVFIFLIAVGVIVPLLPIPGNYQILTVLSGSMEPAIHMGSVVVVKPAHSAGSGQADYKIGDVITFSDGKMSVTHRVHEIKQKTGRNVYVTKGDANNGSDNNEVFKENISGKVLFSVPAAGYVVNAAKRPLGFMLVIIIPAVIIIGDEIRKIRDEIKKIRNNKKYKKKQTPASYPCLNKRDLPACLNSACLDSARPAKRAGR